MKSLFFIVLIIFMTGHPLSVVHSQTGIDNTPTPNTSLDNIPTPNTRLDNTRPTTEIGIINPLGEGTTITSFFLDLIRILLIFAIPIIVFFIIYAGFLMVTANGKPEQISKGKTALLYAVIGGLLILGANLILTVIQGTVDSFRV